MTSKEHILAAMRREKVDYIPCSIYFNPSLDVPGYELSSKLRRPGSGWAEMAAMVRERRKEIGHGGA